MGDCEGLVKKLKQSLIRLIVGTRLVCALSLQNDRRDVLSVYTQKSQVVEVQDFAKWQELPRVETAPPSTRIPGKPLRRNKLQLLAALVAATINAP